MKTIKAHIRLENGNLPSAANVPRVVARATVATDRYGNSLATPPIPGNDRTPYFQRWIIKKEPKGYIFREVRSNLGISGHFPSIRALVIDALFLLGDRLVVTIEV